MCRFNTQTGVFGPSYYTSTSHTLIRSLVLAPFVNAPGIGNPSVGGTPTQTPSPTPTGTSTVTATYSTGASPYPTTSPSFTVSPSSPPTQSNLATASVMPSAIPIDANNMLVVVIGDRGTSLTSGNAVPVTVNGESVATLYGF